MRKYGLGMVLSVDAMGGDCRIYTSVVFISVGDTCMADPYLWFLERDKVSSNRFGVA
jgi:hypothetical protein